MVHGVLSTSIQLTVRPLNPVSKKYLVPLTKSAPSVIRAIIWKQGDYMDTRLRKSWHARTYLLHVTKYVASDCEKARTFLAIQRGYEVCSVIFTAFLVSTKKKKINNMLTVSSCVP